MSASETTQAGIASRTAAAVGVVGRRNDARLILVGSTLGYLALYLYTVGDLAFTGQGGTSIFVVDDLSRAFTSLGFFRFEPIALIEAGPITYLFSPLNALLALTLAVLVGVNLALTYLGWVQPKACGLEASSGVFAGVPALLSGAACCGPTVLLVFGIQASGVLITTFQYLVPVALLLLVGSLLLIGRQVDPARL
ncbi:MAG: hypothetical protein ACI9YT_000199 [Halobacteriales archaeon]|jgi:hypothetical protein